MKIVKRAKAIKSIMIKYGVFIFCTILLSSFIQGCDQNKGIGKLVASIEMPLIW